MKKIVTKLSRINKGKHSGISFILVIATVFAFIVLTSFCKAPKALGEMPEYSMQEHIVQAPLTTEASLTTSQEIDYLLLVKEATKLAILEQLVISENVQKHRIVYANSCENRINGCEAHIASIVDIFFDQYQKRGIDPLILAAIVKHETNYNPFAVNETTRAAGLMQLMPGSRFAEGLTFIHSRQFREQCKSIDGACQEEVVDASTDLLERSIRRCNNNLRQGLGMYGSGSCRGSKRFANYVIRLANHLQQRRDFYLEQLSESYDHSYCDI